MESLIIGLEDSEIGMEVKIQSDGSIYVIHKDVYIESVDLMFDKKYMRKLLLDIGMLDEDETIVEIYTK